MRPSARLPGAHPGASLAQQPLRHPGARPRGVPRRFRGLGSDRLPGAAVVGRHLRPRADRADGRAHRRRHGAVGVHQGLAPVLDVVRDARWGRVEETHRRRPLPGRRDRHRRTCAGWSRPGIVATLKHFVGYSASKAGRNLAPVSVGPRELADVLLPPFEMAMRDGGARSVMNAYTDIDGVPSAADARAAHRVAARHLGIRRAPSSPTTSLSRSSRCCTGSPAPGARPRPRR